METHSRTFSQFGIGIAFLFSIATETRSELIIKAQEIGSDVVFSWGGSDQSLDLAGATYVGTNSGTPAAYIEPNETTFNSFGSYAVRDIYTLPGTYHGNPPFGTGGFRSTSTRSGSSIIIRADSSTISVDENYVSGSPYPTGMSVFPNQTFLSLGITPTNIVLADWNGQGGDSLIRLSFTSPSAIPEPTTALGLLGLVISACLRRRRRLPAL